LNNTDRSDTMSPHSQHANRKASPKHYKATYSTINKSELLPTNNMTCLQWVHGNAIMEWLTISIALTLCLLWFLSFNRQKGCFFSFYSFFMKGSSSLAFIVCICRYWCMMWLRQDHVVSRDATITFWWFWL
jgi:hypothetical protein